MKQVTHWTTPGGMASAVCLDMLQQPHLLIAGSTGSGKSVLINSLIYTALYKSPSAVQLLLVDPKRVELIDFARLPHCIGYASEPDEIAALLTAAVSRMDARYKRMQAARLKTSTEADVYIIIDEFADLMTTQRAETLPQIIRLAQLGRAARMHLIAATQRPTRDIITGQIKVNMDSRVALRCPSAQDSRNILDSNGAELLPRYGLGYYLTPETLRPTLIKIPYTSPAAVAARVAYWQNQPIGIG